jgi:hypothetical protein
VRALLGSRMLGPGARPPGPCRHRAEIAFRRRCAARGLQRHEIADAVIALQHVGQSADLKAMSTRRRSIASPISVDGAFVAGTGPTGSINPPRRQPDRQVAVNRSGHAARTRSCAIALVNVLRADRGRKGQIATGT